MRKKLTNKYREMTHKQKELCFLLVMMIYVTVRGRHFMTFNYATKDLLFLLQFYLPEYQRTDEGKVE